jgi:hypothetical protein
MKDVTVRHLDMGRRVNDFTDSHKASFPAGSRAAVLVGNTSTAVSDLETAGAKQEGAERAGQEATRQRDAAIVVLLTLMRAINRTARGMEKLHPGIAALFKMPRSSGDQIIINTARAFLAEATPRAAEFTARGLPANFLTTLEAAINAVLSAIDAQAEALAAQTAATAAVATAQRELTDAVSELSPIISNIFSNDPATLAAWKSASHVERAPKRAKKATPPPPTP